MPSVDGKIKIPEFHYDLPQPHVVSLICLRATIFQNPEGSLGTYSIWANGCKASPASTLDGDDSFTYILSSFNDSFNSSLYNIE
jgi:hypothetical protein